MRDIKNINVFLVTVMSLSFFLCLSSQFSMGQSESPDSSFLIKKAFSEGKMDKDTYLLTRVQAILAPETLPVCFKCSVDKENIDVQADFISVLKEICLNWDTLRAKTQQDLNPFVESCYLMENCDDVPVIIPLGPFLKLSLLEFLFFPMSYYGTCSPPIPDWEVRARILANLKLEGKEIKTIKMGFSPLPGYYIIPIEGTLSPVEPINEIKLIPTGIYRWGFGFHGGSTFPIMDIGKRYKYSYMFTVNVDYYLSQRFSTALMVGFNAFREKSTGSYLGHTYWWNLSANFKWELTSSGIRPYIKGGGGLYISKSGLTRPGFNAGAGLNRLLNPDLVLDFGIDYHHILTNSEDPEFYVVYAGLIYRLERK